MNRSLGGAGDWPPGRGYPGGYPQYGYPAYGYQGYGSAAYGPGAGTLDPGGVPLRPLGVGDIISGSFTLIRQNPAATLGLTALVVAALATAVFVVFLIAASTTGTVMLVTLPLAAAGFALQTGGLTAALGRGVLGRQLRMAEAMRLARTGWVLLTFLVLLLAAAVIWGPLVGLMKGWGVIPALLLTAWLAVMVSLAVPVVVLESRGPFAAIGRSWRLVRGSYWRLFGIYLLMYLLTWAIGFVLDLPLLFASGLVGGLGPGSKATLSVAAVIYAIGEIVIFSLTATIDLGVIVLVYADMRMRKEGMDLVLRQAAMGRPLSGDEFAASWFTSAYTGGAAYSPYLPPRL
jgi:hypothetical protein